MCLCLLSPVVLAICGGWSFGSGSFYSCCSVWCGFFQVCLCGSPVHGVAEFVVLRLSWGFHCRTVVLFLASASTVGGSVPMVFDFVFWRSRSWFLVFRVLCCRLFSGRLLLNALCFICLTGLVT